MFQWIQRHACWVDGVEEELHEDQQKAEQEGEYEEVGNGSLGYEYLPRLTVENILVDDGARVQQFSQLLVPALQERGLANEEAPCVFREQVEARPVAKVHLGELPFKVHLDLPNFLVHFFQHSLHPHSEPLHNPNAQHPADDEQIDHILHLFDELLLLGLEVT